MNDKARLLHALGNVQDEEAHQGGGTPQTMILRAMNIDPTDRAAAEQAMTLGGELVRVTEQCLGSECWEWAFVGGERERPHGSSDAMAPGDPPQGTMFVMLLAMRLGRELGRLETQGEAASWPE